MLDFIRFALSLVCTAVGLFVIISGVLGVFRFRYSLNRIHAAALLDSLGILLMLLGLIIAEGFDITSVKFLLIIPMLWLTSPVASHLIGKLEVTINEDLPKVVAIGDPEAVAHEKEDN
ncbi:MAG: monovalent cation/H(+) antiporter subunit G [Clostridia bacterium]|nr:monovalent cation/H(+) antiporter subunit G [Clostridia bacterium]